MKEFYKNLINLTEKIAQENLDGVLNEFLFFGAFTKSIPSYNYIYRKISNKPFDNNPLLKALFKAFKYYNRSLIQTFLSFLLYKRKLIEGKINIDTDIVIVTWLHNSDLLKDNEIDVKDKYFGNLGNILKKQGYKIQYLLIPIYSYKEQIFKSFNSSDHLFLFSLKARFQLKEIARLYKNIKQALKLFRYPDEIILYTASFYAIRYFLSLQLKKELIKLLTASNIKLIIIPWESQPEQRAICMAAHDLGIKVWGYCHAAINGSYYHLINHNWYWCPDTLLINGFAYIPLLKEMGWDENRLKVIRSLRYKNLHESDFYKGKLFLPYDVQDSLISLNHFKNIVKNGLHSVKEIRCHPDNLKNKEIKNIIDSIPTDSTASNVFVGGFSSVIFEALQSGCLVFNLITDPLNSQDAYVQFDKIKTTNINDELLKFEPIGELKDYFFCFNDEMKITLDF